MSETPTGSDSLIIVMTRMETKLDMMIKRVDDHEQRIRAGERRWWPLPAVGALAAVGAVVVTLTQR